MRSRVELFENIRRDHRLGEVSIRELADRHKTHRRTVRQALDDAVPPPRKVYPVRPRPAIDEWATLIDGWLIADEDAPRKQRHTARRVWQRLVAEHQATCSEVTVSRHVARRRLELGLLQQEVSIPQTHLAGAEAEVDFGEFYATIAGLVVKCWMFVMRLSHSGKAFHVTFGTQAQEAFLEGHVLAFEYFGGVPGGSGTTTSNPPSSGSSKVVTAPNPNGSPRCAATTDSTRSSAAQGSRVPTRRAAWKARLAASGGATSSPFRRSPRWQSSTRSSALLTSSTTIG